MFGTTVFASSSNSANSANSNITNTQSVGLSKADESNITKSINEVLSLKYDVLKDGKAKDYSDKIKDPKLLKLINKTSDFDVKWFGKFNGKINGYKSNTTISNIKKTSDNTYVLDVVYYVEFKLESAETISKSRENYRIEVKNENGKWFINKRLDKDENISENANANAVAATTDFPDYDNIVNSEIESIDSKSNNINESYEKFKQKETNVDQSKNRINASLAYSGYNYVNAVNYARTYDMSPNYSTYPGSRTYVDNIEDCTDFTSQCARAGGIPPSSYWYAYSNPWIRVLDFYTYMTNNGYGSAGTWTDGARSGDVLQFYSPSKSTWSHGVILIGGDSQGNWLFSGHSRARHDYPLYAAYSENGYSNMRTVRFWR